MNILPQWREQTWKIRPVAEFLTLRRAAAVISSEEAAMPTDAPVNAEALGHALTGTWCGEPGTKRFPV